jgi:hypothetical protein
MKKFNEYKYKIAHISMWTFLKWVRITIVAIYVINATGIKLAQDIRGLRINYQFQVVYSSNGLLSPVLAK